ncbi:MAG TPA: MFS transporter [Pyrinomonadaceae bacterium]|nr:MFS transporter [Pyrinomonadaceae bacterium]
MNPWRGLGALPKEVWYLCLAILVNRAGTMVLPFLTLYLTVDRKFSAGKAGLALTVYGIAAIIVAPIAGRLSDRLGSLAIIKLSLFFSGLILFVFPFVTSFSGILAMTAIWAFVNESFRPPSMALIGRLTGPAQRKMAFALSRLAINLGMSIGPVVGGFLAMRSFRSLFYVDGTSAILAGTLIAIMPWRASQAATVPEVESDSQAPGAATAELSYTSVLRDRRFLYFLIAMLPVEMVFFQSLAAMPLFVVRDLHVSEAGFGMLLAINTVMIILTEVPLNTAMSHWSHRRTIALGALLVGAGFGGLAISGSAGAVAATVVVWTVGEMILLPASSAYVSDIAPAAQTGVYMGLYTMGFSLAFAIGPWLGVEILEKFGPVAVWLGMFGCGCFTALMIWRERTGSRQ